MNENGHRLRVALVTGASSGIGEATANRLVEAGYRVFGTSRRGGASGSRSFSMLTLDVTDDESVAACIAQVVREAGRIDLLVNNAGFGVAPAGAEESSLEQAKAIFDTNLFGAIRMTRAVLPQMRAQGGGRIVNVGSALGFIPMPYMALYSATKYALAGYSESIDHELRTLGIRVSVVEPASIRTSFDANSLEADLKLEVYADVREKLARKMKAMVEGGEDPGVVADCVIQAATEARPRLRYAAGKTAKQLRWLQRWAPESVLDAGIRKNIGLVPMAKQALLQPAGSSGSRR
jgi:NAD(P)-dependent dehydrogenase (short-subunit alcohol dehydrogenase family)